MRTGLGRGPPSPCEGLVPGVRYYGPSTPNEMRQPGKAAPGRGRVGWRPRRPAAGRRRGLHSRPHRLPLPLWGHTLERGPGGSLQRLRAEHSSTAPPAPPPHADPSPRGAGLVPRMAQAALRPRARPGRLLSGEWLTRQRGPRWPGSLWPRRVARPPGLTLPSGGGEGEGSRRPVQGGSPGDPELQVGGGRWLGHL